MALNVGPIEATKDETAGPIAAAAVVMALTAAVMAGIMNGNKTRTHLSQQKKN